MSFQAKIKEAPWMRRKKSFKQLVLFCLILIFFGRIANASIVTTATTDGASLTQYAASAVDLIQSGSATLGSEVHVGYNPGIGGLTTTFNDGLNSNVIYDVDGVWTSTYNLDLTNAPRGYNLTETRTIAGWGDNRASQLYELLVSYINDSSFTSLGTFSVTGIGVSSQIALTDSTGKIGIGIDAIRFSILQVVVPLTETVYSEFDVFGSAIANNTPVVYLFPTYTTTPSTNETIFIDGTNAGAGAGSYGQVVSSGAVTLNGGTLKPQTSFTGSSGFAPTYGQSFTLVTGSSVAGSYSAIDNSGNPSSLKFIAEYKNTQVNVFATPGDYSRDVPNLSASQKSLGKALNTVVTSSVDNRSGVLQSAREKITNALMRLSTPQLQTAIAQMDPTNLQGMSQSVLQGSQMLQSGFRGRVDQLQSGTRGGVTINGMSLTNLQGEYEYELVADMEIPYLVKRQRRLASYWINGTGSWGDVENEAQNSGYQFYGMGSQVGMDHTFENGWTAGVMLWEGYEKSSLAMRDSVMKSHRGGGGLYAHKEWRGFYWGGYAGAGKVFYETDRAIDFLAEKASGETEGILLQGWNELGYEMRWKNWGFGPTLGVGFNRIMIDGYKETGSSAALQLDDQTQDSLSHQLGFRVQSFWKWLGIGIQPSLRMSWDHEYLTPNEMNSKFVAGGDWFQSDLRELDQDTMGMRIGLAIMRDDRWTMTTSYQTQLLAPQYSAHSVDLGMRYGF